MFNDDATIFAKQMAERIDAAWPRKEDVDEQSCDNCQFALKGEVRKDLTRDLYCRRYPPHCVPMMGPNGPMFQGQFPPTGPTMWCGEWAPDETVVKQ